MKKVKPTPQNNVSSRIDAELKQNLVRLAESQDIKLSKLIYNILRDYWNNIHQPNWNYYILKNECQKVTEKYQQLQKSYSVLESLHKEQDSKLKAYERKNEELKQSKAVLKERYEEQITALKEEHEMQITALKEEHKRSKYSDDYISPYKLNRKLQLLKDTYQKGNIEIINASLEAAAHNSDPDNLFDFKTINDFLTT